MLTRRPMLTVAGLAVAAAWLAGVEPRAQSQVHGGRTGATGQRAVAAATATPVQQAGYMTDLITQQQLAAWEADVDAEARANGTTSFNAGRGGRAGGRGGPGRGQP